MKHNAYKKTFMALAFSFLATGAFAQFSIGANLSFPMSTPFSDFYGMAFGGSVRYDGQINDNLAWSGHFGYNSFGGTNGNTYNLSIIPITAGVKYYFTEMGNGFYGAADLGFFLGNSSAPNSSGESKFGFNFGAGYRMGTWDFSARYNLISYSGFDANNLGISVAYVLNSGK